jgi:tetratricopeptide (TPR) repeat protein
MVLRVNENEEAQVYLDDAVIFSVSLVNDDAIYASSHNEPLDEQIKELKREYEAKQIGEEEFKNSINEIEQQKLTVKTYRFGGHGGWPSFIKFESIIDKEWKEVNWPLWLLLYQPHDQIANLDGSTSCYAEFGLDPRDSKRPQGKLQVKSYVQMYEGETIESNEVIVEFLAERMSRSKRNKEEVLLSLVRYYYKRRKFEEALKLIQRTLKVNPHSIPALDILGDIESSRGNLRIALNTYKKALEAFYKQQPDIREPPRLLITKIRDLSESIDETEGNDEGSEQST